MINVSLNFVEGPRKKKCNAKGTNILKVLLEALKMDVKWIDSVLRVCCLNDQLLSR